MRALARLVAASFVADGLLGAMTSVQWGGLIAAGCAVAAWSVLRGAARLRY